MWDFIAANWPTVAGAACVILAFWSSWKQGQEKRRWIATTRRCSACGGTGRVPPSEQARGEGGI